MNSPLDLLIAHMVQHELLMLLAPPFILLANPVPVLMWGLTDGARGAGRPSSEAATRRYGACAMS